MKQKQYFIQCGNWCVKLHINTKLFINPHECYVELATRAVEIIFGSGEFKDKMDDFYTMVNDKGVNVLETDDQVIPTFTTKIHILSSKSDHPNELLTTLRTADIFVNAAQWENYQFALDAEKDEK